MAPITAPPREIRKTVTIVLSDLVGSTALAERIDPEALHEITERYFNAMAAEIARHGGRIEKYIGDAIKAVFGLPRAHEDDSLRAVRAAAGMRDALVRVNAGLLARYGVELANRTGVNTGEVVANDDPDADQRTAIGDVVNVAARLEQAAPRNEVYLGESTYRLVRDAVEVEAVEPLELKGKAQRVPAFRLLTARGLDGTVRRSDTPIVGRDAELAEIARVYDEVVARPEVRMVTIVGEAGVGKSRLAHEVVARIASGACVLRGRCLPYGDGITFWPLVEMVRQAADIHEDDSPGQARARLQAVVGQTDVAERLASATGLATANFPLAEINWAARKFFETLAAAAPLLLVVDDIHWAEVALLELLAHVRDGAHDAPILLLATARPDLLEAHPDWATKPKDVKLVLGPLNSAAAAAVINNMLGADLPADLASRIVGAAEGNPLYVEQMLSMLIDSRVLREEEGRWQCADDRFEIQIPPTIRALLEARLDQLPGDVRATIEPASVIGLEFAQSAVETLMPDQLRPHAGASLATLTRRHFIRPVPAAGSDIAYRFQHHLVRDTVYGGLLKRSRATLHMAFVRWADRVNVEHGRGLEFEEILGYHLEQAYRYACELGSPDEAEMAIAADAARRLSAAGKRAATRGDTHAAANLYRRAVALLDRSDPRRLVLLSEFGEVLEELAAFDEAHAVLAEAQQTAEHAGNRRIAASARLLRMRIRLFNAEPGASSDEALRAANEVVPLLEAEEAHSELARAWRMIGMIHGSSARYGLASDAVSRSTTHARLAGDAHGIARNTVGLASGALLGPMPVPQAIDLCEQLRGQALGDRRAEGKILCAMAQLHAMNGEFEAARDCYRRGRAVLHELGSSLSAAATGCDVLCVELIAGDLAAALREAMPDFEFLKRAGETYYMSTIAALISRVMREMGRDDDAMEFSLIAEDATAVDDVESQALWRSIRAPILACAGRLSEAESLARSAVASAQSTDALIMQADTARELATVLSLAGLPEESRRSIDVAIGIYEAKGDIVSAARSRAWRDELRTC
jgi:class 3 adenylate cyclase/tetratricopeptide (TPR) repeat protein